MKLILKMETVKSNLIFYFGLSLFHLYSLWTYSLGLVAAYMFFVWSEYEKKVATRDFMKMHKDMLVYIDFQEQ